MMFEILFPGASAEWQVMLMILERICYAFIGFFVMMFFLALALSERFQKLINHNQDEADHIAMKFDNARAVEPTMQEAVWSGIIHLNTTLRIAVAMLGAVILAIAL